MLHVGSCIPRKRIDVLIDVFAEVRGTRRDLRLIQVGGQWSGAQREQIARHDLSRHIVQIRDVERATIANLYHRAAAVLLTSEAEGFGLPAIEALACGSLMVASDIPPLREVAGPAAVYCPVADVPAWTDTLLHLLAEPARQPPLEMRLTQARRYSWHTHTETIARAYANLTAAGN